MEGKKAVPQFYRRILPPSCVSFYSEEGKSIFKEALATSNMECYFKLAAQFRTQDEPAFCGLTTLVMVLNALEVDPGEVWKGPWRWYHEKMLDCCIPLSIIEKDGVTFDEFVCLADCNSLDTNPVKVDSGITFDEFRDLVKDFSQRDDSFLILSYSRKVLNQTGDGHFSPVGGYHPEKDLVLILDTARFKYPPHWVKLPLIWESMHALDKTTGKPRGFVTVKKRDSLPLHQGEMLALFKISSSFDIVKKSVLSPGMIKFVKSWQHWLSKDSTNATEVSGILGHILDQLSQSVKCLDTNEQIFTTQIDVKCMENISNEHACVTKNLLSKIESSVIYSLTQTLIEQQNYGNGFSNIGTLASDLPEGVERCLSCRMNQSHFITMFLLSWPYDRDVLEDQNKNGNVLKNLVSKYIGDDVNDVLSSEANILQKQFKTLLDLRKKREKVCSESCCHKDQ